MDAQKLKGWLWLVVEAIVFIAIIAGVYGYMSNKLDKTEQNLIVAEGQLHEVQLKNGELISVRDSHIATINDLEKLLGVTKSEAKDLQKKLDSKIAYISNIESQVKIEYIETVRDSIVYVDSTKNHIISRFYYNDQWLSFAGENDIWLNPYDCNTVLNNIKMEVPLTIGLTNDYQVFAKSDNPYVQFTNIDGVVIDEEKLRPKKRKINWGFQIGFGAMYDILHSQMTIGPYGGVGIEFNF